MHRDTRSQRPRARRVARSTTIVTWPERRLDAVAAARSSRSRPRARRRRVPASRAPLERHADERRLRIGVGRAWQRAVVGRDVLAERHPDGQLALVVRLVGVQLRAGRRRRRRTGRPRRAAGRRAGTAASGPTCRGRSAPARGPRAGTSRPTARRITCPSAVEPSSRSMTCAPSRPAPARACTARTPVRTVTPSRFERLARSTSELRGWSVGASRGPDWTIVVGTPKRGVDLGQFAAGRAAAQDQQAARQLAGQRRLLVGPRLRLGEARRYRPVSRPSRPRRRRASPSARAPAPSWLIVTTPGPAIRPSPRYAVAPASSSAVTWPVSSGSSASAERLTM